MTAAEHREPIVLEGGPRDGWWYWRNEFLTMQFAAEAIANIHRRLPNTVESWSLHYHETTRTQPHKTQDQVGTVWEWQRVRNHRPRRRPPRPPLRRDRPQPRLPRPVPEDQARADRAHRRRGGGLTVTRQKLHHPDCAARGSPRGR